MSKTSRILAWVLVALFVLVRWMMVRHYPASNGFDSHGHIDYMNLVYAGVLPDPNQLWQGYHAPAYYIFSSWLAHLSGFSPLSVGQAVSAACSLLMALPGYYLARRLVPGWEPLALLSLLMLPSSINTCAMVYSQQMATLMVGLFLAVLFSAWCSERLSVPREIALGALWAASIWSRFDGFFLGPAVAALWLSRVYRERRNWAHAGLAFLLTCTVCLALISPLLFRNLALFNQPVIRNRDARLFPYSLKTDDILPNFLSPRCLVDPGIELWKDPRSRNVESLPVMLFLRFWGANQVNALPPQLMAFLGLVLAGTVVLGMRASWRDQRWWSLYAVALSNLLLMAIFLAGEPDITGYKAIYYHGAYFLVALCLTKGAEVASRSWRRPDLMLGLSCYLPMALYALGYLMYWRS